MYVNVYQTGRSLIDTVYMLLSKHKKAAWSCFKYSLFSLSQKLILTAN